MTAREWLDAVEACWPYGEGTHNEVALVAALRAVLDLHQRTEDALGLYVGCTTCGRPFPTFSNPNPDPTWPCPTVAAIDTHLGGAS